MAPGVALPTAPVLVRVTLVELPTALTVYAPPPATKMGCPTAIHAVLPTDTATVELTAGWVKDALVVV